ncbi:MAG: glycosyltransferase family 2 protein [Lachnospiraceae bacterium]|nr:glycosyltransferase family 2 protein [Lachnospiraceae bacterium]
MNVILIPAYKPDEELLKLIDALAEKQLAILVVDDGSGSEYEEIFAQAAKRAVVIHNSDNLGKGAALKKGMSELTSYYPECTHFITVDSDGQHRIEDILRVHEALIQGASMVLTIRDLHGNIPAKSKFGNTLSRWVYTLLTGHYLADNQSGLRGFSVTHIPWLLQVAGDKYDYEINVIYYADKQDIDITTVSIESIYIDGNRSSHFEPALDTFRIYKCLFTSAKGTLIGALLYEAAIIATSILLGNQWWMFTIPASGILAAVVCLLIDRFSFRNIKPKKEIGTFVGSVLRSILYTIGCGVVIKTLPKLPILLVFNLFVLFMIPVRYNLHRLYTGRSRRHSA